MKSEHHLYKMIYICIYVKDITLRGGKKQTANKSLHRETTMYRLCSDCVLHYNLNLLISNSNMMKVSKIY